MKEGIVSPGARFLLLPIPGFTMLPLGAFLDKLNYSAQFADASQHRNCEWVIAGIQSDHIESAGGVFIRTEVGAGEVQLADYGYLVLFGGASPAEISGMAPVYQELLQKAAELGLRLVCVDTACVLLAACGLLNDCKVAIHWRYESQVRSTYPQVQWRSDVPICFDGDRISCLGGEAAIDLALELLIHEIGQEKAFIGLSDMQRGDNNNQEYLTRPVGSPPGGHVERVVTMMRQQMASGATTEDLAASIGISRRHLDRVFRASLGVTANEYWAEMRLQHVKWCLVNTSRSLALIAEEIGVSDASYLSKMIRRRFGDSAVTIRQAARNGAAPLLGKSRAERVGRNKT